MFLPKILNRYSKLINPKSKQVIVKSTLIRERRCFKNRKFTLIRPVENAFDCVTSPKEVGT